MCLRNDSSGVQRISSWGINLDCLSFFFLFLFFSTRNMNKVVYHYYYYKSSAIAEMGDRGQNRHEPKRGGGVLSPFRGALGTHLIQCGLRRCLLPYQVASSSIQPFGHNSVGCHSPHRNISTNYYLVVEMHTVTVRSVCLV